jgi:hydroxypyruvate isomerase
VITFSGNRRGKADAERPDNCAIGLNQVKKLAEDQGVTICVELLNSKIDHHDYQCDHTAWGVELIKRVGSPRVKLLYDIYHMQIMEGDIIRTIRQNIQHIAHFHTGGVPGRHELDGTQELQVAGGRGGHCGDWIHGLLRARIRAHARSDDVAGRGGKVVRCVAGEA